MPPSGKKKAKILIVTNETQKTEMEMARTGRLFLREKRIAIEKTRKELKEQALREGKAIDGIANVLKALIVPIEEYLGKQEKFAEIQAEKKREAERIAAEKRIEEERIKQEQIQQLHRERREILLPYKYWWEPELETTNLGKIDEGNFKNILSSLKQEKADYDAEQERIRLENERLKKEAEEKERKAREERELHEKQLAKERAEAEKKRKEIAKQEEAKRKAIEEKARREREKREKEIAEDKRKAEEKARKEREMAQAKAEAERKEKERLAEMLKNQIECPKCGHKFQRKP